MLAAKQSFDAGDLKTARTQLAWVAENAKGELRDVARLRLAGIALDEKAYDDALKQLDAASQPAFEARFQELKGDKNHLSPTPDFLKNTRRDSGQLRTRREQQSIIRLSFCRPRGQSNREQRNVACTF